MRPMIAVDDDDFPKSSPANPLPWIGGIAILAAAGWIGFGAFNGLKHGTALAAIHGDPRSFDGQVVTISGRVGDVFQIGDNHAFFLRQGRDTIVVMSRYRAPAPNQKLTVTGSVSMGYMDGRPRPALFESAPTK